MTQIRECPNCREQKSPAAEFQDRAYGKGNRVHNIGKKDGQISCSVCGFKYTASSPKAPKEGEESKGGKKGKGKK